MHCKRLPSKTSYKKQRSPLKANMRNRKAFWVSIKGNLIMGVKLKVHHVNPFLIVYIASYGRKAYAYITVISSGYYKK